MQLPVCKKCSARIPWTKLYQSVWVGYKSIKCEECNEKNEISSYTMGKVSLLVFVPTLLAGLFIANMIEASSIVSLLIVLVTFSIFSLYVPYLIRFKDSN